MTFMFIVTIFVDLRVVDIGVSTVTMIYIDVDVESRGHARFPE